MQVIEVLALSQEVEHLQEYEDYLESLIRNSNEIPESAYVIADYVQQKGNTLLGYKGGSAYKNIPANVSGQTLPQICNYKEYDINIYIKGMDRGAERIVIGQDKSVWYTNNHYLTFTKIK